MSADSVSEAVGSPVEKYGRSWPRIPISDYGTLETKFRTDRKASIRGAIEGDEALSPRDRAEMLAASVGPVTVNAMDAWLLTHPGATEALRVSLRRAGCTLKADQDAAIDAIPDIDHACSLARVLVGFARETTPEEAARAAAKAAGGKFVKGGEPADPS